MTKHSEVISRIKLVIVVSSSIIISILKAVLNPVGGNQVQFTGVYALIAMISYTISENTVEIYVTLKESIGNIPEKHLIPAVLLLRLVLVAAAIHSLYIFLFTL